jgi:Terminase large subunit, T4likevirus-type, N-terminal
MTQAPPALSVAEFAQRILKKPLWPHQVDLVESPAFVTVVAAARRTGKTEAAETLAMWTAFTHARCKVIILSAGQDAARRVTESIAAELNSHSATRGSVTDDYSTRITLSNGSEIVSLPASQKQIRGFGKNVKLVILDEAGFMTAEIYRAASYIALDERGNGSRILLLGTPWGPADHFFRRAYQAGLDGDQDHATFHWSIKVNPLLDHAYLERQRDRVSPSEYAAEVLGEWSDAVGALFSRELLERQTCDVEIPQLRELKLPARGVIGVDWGYSYDRSAAVALYRLPVAGLNPDARSIPRFIALPYIWPQGAPLHEVVEALAVNLSPYAYVSPECNGIGAMPASELRRRGEQLRGHRGDRQKKIWNYVSTTNAGKTAGYGLILALLEREALILPRHPDLLRQLAGLQLTQGERGFSFIEAENNAVKDDVADALMLCALPYKPPAAHRVICHLAALAGSSRAPADARVPDVSCGLVETGGGLKVPQVPTLQSVASQEYTTYAPVEPAQPEGFRTEHFQVTTTKQGVM